MCYFFRIHTSVLPPRKKGEMPCLMGFGHLADKNSYLVERGIILEQDAKLNYRFCLSCGEELVPSNSKGVRNTWFQTGYLPWCIDCQTAKVKELQKQCKDKVMAIYIYCAACDTPFYAEIAHQSKDWKQYLQNLREQNLNRNAQSGEYATFGAGETVYEKAEPKKRKDTSLAQARERWGAKFSEGGEPVEYTKRELEELESLYKEQAAEYKGAITPRVDMSLREICVSRLEWKRCVGVGDSQGAKRYSDMIKDAMAREGMRATDVKPLEAMKVDALITHLEEKGAVQNNQIVGVDELRAILAKDHPQYHTSLDVVDEIIMCTVNTMRRNNGESELIELPKEGQVKDVFHELLDKPTEHEQEVMAELGILPPVRES